MSIIVDNYTIYGPRGGVYGKLTEWKFQGSNDDAAWTDLDSQTGQNVTGDFTPYNFAFVNVASFRWYRLYITAITVGGTDLEIPYLQLFNGVTDLTPLMTDYALPVPYIATASQEPYGTYPIWEAFNPAHGDHFGWYANWGGPEWLKLDTGPPIIPPVPPAPDTWNIPFGNSRPCMTGRMTNESGDVINIADLLEGTSSVVASGRNPGSPMTGRMLKEDGSVANIADLLGG